ncbi:MAG: hypothetical protein UD103_07760 [Bacteroidales bacterium]|nr:hypothetical protein [Bacteroidales bacterium]
MKQINSKVNLNISGVVNPNIPNWQFNAVLPTYQVLDIEESLKQKKWITKQIQWQGNNSFYVDFLKIPANAKSLKATTEFIRLVNEGVVSLITTGVTDYFRKTKYNADDYTNALRKVIEQKIDFTALSSTARTDDILGYVRDIFFSYLMFTTEFYRKMYDLVATYNKYNFSKLTKKNFNTKWYYWIPLLGVPLGAIIKGVYSEIQDIQFGKDYLQMEDFNAQIYSKLPKNTSFENYLSLVGVPQNDINAFAQEEAEKENNIGNKKGTGKTTTNSNITPLLIGVAIIVLVIYLKKRKGK